MKQLFLALAIAGGLLAGACEDPTKSSPAGGNIAVTFNNLTADGSSTATTTKLTLTFSQDIAGLAAADITLNANSTGAQKGTLTKTGTGIYDLAVSGITAGGTVSVSVAKSGYTISGGTKTAPVYYYTPSGGNIAVTFNNLTADGSAAATTTKLTLTFSQDIAGLAAADITLNGNNTGAQKGTLTRTGTGIYDLAVSGITAGGTVSVSVAKSGYTISGGTKTAPVYYYTPSGGNIAVTFNNLTADGSATATTTKLTLSFSQDIAGLAAADITLNGNNTGAQKGTLTKTGTGIYDLAVSGITAGGTVSVAVAKTGYTISGGTKTAQVYYYTPSGGNTTVTSEADSGPGTLRYAIDNAPENSVIVIGNGVRTITLESRLQITRNLTIQGNGVTITRAASWTSVSGFSQLLFLPRSSAMVNISRVHFKDGRVTDWGAAICNGGNLTLESCVFSGNQTSGRQGGAINTEYEGTLIVKGCTFYGNSSRYGGAVYMQSGTVILTGNLFYGNTAADSGPVVYREAGTVTSGGYNVVDVALGTETTQSGFASATGDKVIGSLPISPADFRLFAGSGAANTIAPLPAGYPTVDFYGSAIINGAASGAVQSYTNSSVAIVAFNSLTADGSPSATTAKLTLVFDNDIDGLAAADITLTANSTGAQKGALSRIGTGTYELALSGITAGGPVSVSAAKTGYVINGGPQTATVYYNSLPAAVTFNSLTADGSPTATTTKLTLVFDNDITGLTAADITLNANSTGAQKGTLIRTGTGTYELALPGITAGGLVSVSAAKTGYAVSGGPQTATVYYSSSGSGSASLTITFTQIADAAPAITGPTLYRYSNNGPTSETLTVANPGQYTSISWRVDNTTVTGTGASFTLSAANSAYNSIAGHFVTLSVIKNGVPYNQTVSFTVEY